MDKVASPITNTRWLLDKVYFYDLYSTDAIICFYNRSGPGKITLEDDLKKVLFTHKHALESCEYYKNCLSSETEFDLLPDGKVLFKFEMAPGIDIMSYLGCFELMYHEHISTTDFVSVDYAIDVISVANLLGFHRCLEKCYDFLSGIDWTQDSAERIERQFLRMKQIPRRDLYDKLTVDLLYSDESLRVLHHAMVAATPDMRKPLKFKKSNAWKSHERRYYEMRRRMVLECKYTETKELLNLLTPPPTRVALHEKWLEICELVKQAKDSEERNKQIVHWATFFHELFDSSFADFALETIIMDKNLIVAITDCIYECNVSPKARVLDRLESIFSRIFEMVGGGGNKYYPTPSWVMYPLCETWSWFIEKQFRSSQRVNDSFHMIFKKLRPHQQSRFLSNQSRYSNQLYEDCYKTWQKAMLDLGSERWFLLYEISAKRYYKTKELEQQKRQKTLLLDY